MKKINEMTELEILALTDDQIEKIVKYRKAEEGVVLMEKPIEPSYEEEPNKDITLYTSSWLSWIHFESSSIVQELNSTFEKLIDSAYYSRYSGDPKKVSSLTSWEKDSASIQLKTDTYYSASILEIAWQIKKRNDEKRVNYERLQKDYDWYIENAQWIIDEVWNKVFETRRKYQRLANLQNSYSEYKILADGNEEIAMNFLKKAHAITSDEEALITWIKITF